MDRNFILKIEPCWAALIEYVLECVYARCDHASTVVTSKPLDISHVSGYDRVWIVITARNSSCDTTVHCNINFTTNEDKLNEIFIQVTDYSVDNFQRDLLCIYRSTWKELCYYTSCLYDDLPHYLENTECIMFDACDSIDECKTKMNFFRGGREV